MIKATSTIKMNFPRIRQLSKAAVTALEMTAEALHTEVVQAQVIPRMDGVLQGEKMFVDYSQAAHGKVSIVHEGPYARRLYYHPEYDFHTGPWEEDWVDRDGKHHHVTHEGNPNARGKWFEDWEPGGSKADFAQKAFKQFYKKEGGV